MTQKSRKIRAIAAGGAVLGVGAAVTLAAWSDSEFAEGIFGTGSFDIQSATDGISFESNEEGVPLPLAFEGGNDLAPGASVYNAYQLHNAGTVDAYVAYSQAENGVAANFDVEFRPVVDTTCDAASFEAGSPIAAGEEFTLAPDAYGFYCFEVTLPTEYEDASAAEGDITWSFEALQESRAEAAA